jgi:hypothetical protein
MTKPLNDLLYDPAAVMTTSLQTPGKAEEVEFSPIDEELEEVEDVSENDAEGVIDTDFEALTDQESPPIPGTLFALNPRATLFIPEERGKHHDHVKPLNGRANEFVPGPPWPYNASVYADALKFIGYGKSRLVFPFKDKNSGRRGQLPALPSLIFHKSVVVYATSWNGPRQ